MSEETNFRKRNLEYKEKGDLKSSTDSEDEIHETKNTSHRFNFPISSRRLAWIILLLSLFLALFLSCFLIFQVFEISYPQSYSLPSPPPLVNPIYTSQVKNVSRLFEGQIEGPEFLVYENEKIFTGTMRGEIKEMDLNLAVVREVTRLAPKNCKQEEECGRPLGMELDQDEFLVVLDAHRGIFKVHPDLGNFYQMSSSQTTKKTPSDLKLHFLNDLEITSDGEMFFTDSSHFRRQDFLQDLLQGSSTGKLLSFDPTTSHIKLLAKGLSFPNGLILSKFQDHLLVAETFRARISKYNLKGINAGKVETFVENLPCLPDNMHLTPRGTIWVASSLARHQSKLFNLVDFLQDKVLLRKILSMLPLDFLIKFIKTTSIFLELDGETGEILRTLVDDLHLFTHASHVIEGKDPFHLYIGSYIDNYLGFVQL